ncbi:MAG: peptidoglycan DD-metalloendopeptidase family protein [Bdellovibrionales bacterium]|nr:peptidoglycan DD-metalloendopeptidase family protein [Bdellovibrionales bacterium]
MKQAGIVGLTKSPRLLTWIGVVVLSHLMAPRVHAADAVEQIKQTQSELNEIDFKKRDVLGSLYEINLKLKRTNRERGRYEAQRNQTFRSVQQTTALVQQLSKQMLQKKQKLLGRLKAMYKLGDSGILRMVFTADSHRDLDIGMRFLKNMVEADYRLIQDFQASLRELSGKKDFLKKQEMRLGQLEKKIRIREESLISKQKVKGEILGRIEQDHALRAEELKKIRGSLPQDKRLDQLVRPMFFEKKGKLNSPLNGPPALKFGNLEREPGILLRHRGWSWNPTASDAIRAVYDGKVVFASDIPGLGKTLVIDHGDHYFSTYGAVTQISVKKGDGVKENEVLGSSPMTGSGRVYFEIRHFSEPLDPAAWLAVAPGPRL